MPELIPSKSPPKTDFAISLSLSLMSAMSLICSAPYFEGLDAWIYETRQNLDPALLDEMTLILGFPGHFHCFTRQIYTRVLAKNSAMSYKTFIERLSALAEKEYIAMAHHALANSDRHSLPQDAVQALLQNPTELAEYLSRTHLKTDLDATIAFLQDLTSLKTRFIAIIERFWQERYQEEWIATLPLMERSVLYHRRQRYRLNYSDLFTAVTGRILPQSQADQIPEQIHFIPSCYVGPYFTSIRDADKLVVFYNCRITPMGRRPGEGPGLFPLLKALGDETRLQIIEMLQRREMYAQQIVNRLDISQAAVSRHLKLMVRAGVLDVRRKGGSKFYSVNTSTLTYLADAIRELGE